LVQGNIDKEKAKTAAGEAKAQAIMAQEASPQANSLAAVAAPIVTAAVTGSPSFYQLYTTGYHQRQDS
jgi:hypothetical protein